MNTPAPQANVTLDNCASEPIHIPGAIQPHGALLVFDADDGLVGWSHNAATLLGIAPAAGQALASLGLPAEAQATLLATVAEAGLSSAAPASAPVAWGGHTFDVVVHRHQGRLLVEFERRTVPTDEVSRFALQAHRSIERLRREGDIGLLLGHAVNEVRALTGFDRVMAYRFRHDASGEVVAESLRDGLDPFLGQRYPASDIPPQARRLYTINTLRIIADVAYTPVPMVEPAMGQPPIDMSHAVLRSVSPIHVEYLRNMGVQASMSVSIVVRGELWGLIACHHAAPLQVPYSVRMACDVLAQVLAANVMAITARTEAAFSARGTALLSEVIGAVSADDNTLPALQRHAPALRELLGADALVLAEQGRLLVEGDLPPPLAQTVAAALHQDDRLRHWTAAEEWPDSAAALPAAGWTGLLALPFDRATRGVLVALRREQVEHVRWGGPPHKTVTLGPNGPRLTPRGSFAEWKETVRGRSVPWDAMQIDLAARLLAELQRACNTRHAETQDARRQLLAMLGHDLRDPLQSISMVAAMMKRSDEANRLGHRLASSSGRMQRLISQVLDMSRLDAGMRLTSRAQPTDLVPLLADLLEETRVGHPGVVVLLQAPDALVARVDGDRVAQLIGNLVGNARHHGTPGEPIELALATQDGQAELRVANVAPPIPEQRLPHLFTPFRARDDSALLNRTGLGMGLYIAHTIATEHGGTLHHAYEDGRVCFYARLPLDGPA